MIVNVYQRIHIDFMFILNVKNHAVDEQKSKGQNKLQLCVNADELTSQDWPLILIILVIF